MINLTRHWRMHFLQHDLNCVCKWILPFYAVSDGLGNGLYQFAGVLHFAINYVIQLFIVNGVAYIVLPDARYYRPEFNLDIHYKLRP